MVHVPNEFRYDYWAVSGATEDNVELNCFMPTGICILLPVKRDATLLEIKEDLWEEASKHPSRGSLHDASSYIFSCINSMAETEALCDENKRLCDVRPFCALLRVIERSTKKADKVLQNQISHLIGKGLHEFDSLQSTEVNDFRWKMKMLGEELSRERQNKTWLERLYYQYPPRLVPPKSQSETSRRHGETFVLVARFENTESSFCFNVPYSLRPSQLLTQILNKKSMTLNTKEDPAKFALKALGREEYLVGDYPIIQFAYIHDTLAKDTIPTVVTVSLNSIAGKASRLKRGGRFRLSRRKRDGAQVCFPARNPVAVNAARHFHPHRCANSTHTLLSPQRTFVDKADLETEEDAEKRAIQQSSTLTLRKKGKHVSSWKIQEKFKFKVCDILRLNCNAKEVGLQAGLFHGGKSLCEPQKTQEHSVDNGTAVFNDDLCFDLFVSNIPRMARLCLVVYEISKSAKGVRSRRLKDSKQELYTVPIAWVNVTVYDFKSQLRTGSMTLYMWNYAEDIQSDYLLHPLGTVVSNPNLDTATHLTLTFEKYTMETTKDITKEIPKDSTIVYPSLEKVQKYAEENTAINKKLEQYSKTASLLSNKTYLESLKPSVEIHEQERERIWQLRYDCMFEVPYQLPILLECVEWNNHMEVSEVTVLLHMWPKLPVEKALELLDYAYADQAVRSYAVKCLQDVNDDDLSLYLLQLVQAIKHESFLSCDLVEFLLRRALNNQKIGHYLFWHLRSEMQVASVSVRFGLILEAYCWGSQEHMKLLTKQMEFLQKLKGTSEQVRTRKDKDKARHFLQEYLSESHCVEAMSKVLCPLDPSYRCKKIKVDKCRVMDSKMRPLWIVFENDDPYAGDIYVIFKNGDDLRQDMLTLQMIRIMDLLWKKEGLDLMMNPYACISTDHRVGLIEVVLDAETIANIQKEKSMISATAAFQRGSLLAWLKDYNQSEAKLNKAIETFTLSCAGYCVATYILGVADRHSDNIMVKKTGQLFHIDFGHILGHFKEKFGFRRERVPFVLTHDFVHVINKGQAKKEKALEFQMFQNHCEKAFQILRRHGTFILSLFAMMISTGLPELSSEKDLNYLRETLVLDLSEQDALLHFRSKFDEALCNSWKTSLNWASHNVSKNNKQ